MMTRKTWRWRSAILALVAGMAQGVALAADPAPMPGAPAALPATEASAAAQPALIFKVQSPNERLTLTVNSSRILALGQKIPQAQVNNPEIVELHALAPNQVQVFAKAPGVTQVNLWGEDQKIYTVDVIVYGDARALTMLLQSEFPNSAIKAVPVGSGVLLSGYVDQPEHISRIIQVAEEFYPKVLNNLTVAGTQQVLLHVKVMEVSRTKLRTLGFDFTNISNGNVVFSGISGLITSASASGISTSGNETFAWSVVDGSSAFFGVLEALRHDNLMKVLAEPKLTTVSGRPAFFNCGGEFPILVPQGFGTVSIEYRKFGTQVDFVPIVLGNGRIHLDVRPRVSEIDSSRSVTINSTNVPGLRTREAETGVEMNAGQTLAIAGLVQTREEAENRGLPWVSELPYLGAAFRRVRHTYNEIELLILVTPQLVDALDAEAVPQCGPGMRTAPPSDFELFAKGHLEVPNCCPTACPNGPAMGNGYAPAQGEVIEPVPAPPSASPSDQSRRGGAAGPQASTAGRVAPYNRANPQGSNTPSAARGNNSEPGFIGPVGYDEK